MIGISLALSLGNPILSKGVPVPPAGFVFLVRPDGTYLTNPAGAYFLRAV